MLVDVMGLFRPISATPAQRLAWLEEVLEIAYRAGALEGRRGGADGR